jgi:hypothetical protein
VNRALAPALCAAALAAAVLTAAAAGPASAKTLVRSAALVGSIAATAHSGARDVEAYSTGFPVGQFDPALGTLQSVTLSLSATIHQTGDVSADSFDPFRPFGGISAGAFTFAGIGGIGFADFYFSSGPTDLTDIVACAPTAAGGCAGTIDSLESFSDATTFTDPPSLSAYTGTGHMFFDYGLNLTAVLGSLLGPPDVPSTFETALAFKDSALTVSYDYIPAARAGVPEPAAWALMLAGFALAGATLRGRAPRLGALR